LKGLINICKVQFLVFADVLYLAALYGCKDYAFSFDCLYDDFFKEDSPVFSMVDIKIILQEKILETIQNLIPSEKDF